MEDGGGGAVHLPDSEHRAAGGEVFEYLARQNFGIFRFLPERQQKNVRTALLQHRLLVRQIAKIHEILSKTPLPYGFYDFRIRLAGQSDLQAAAELGILPAFGGKSVPEIERIAVGGKESRVDNGELVGELFLRSRW